MKTINWTVTTNKGRVLAEGTSIDELNANRNAKDAAKRLNVKRFVIVVAAQRKSRKVAA